MTSNLLKIIALICMTIDHVGEFFPDMPIWFRWIGRISAPIFLFVFVHTLTYTSDKRKLLQRLYLFNIIMCIVGLNINKYYILQTMDGFSNNIFGTFFAIAIIILLLESIRSNEKNNKRYLIGYILLQVVSTGGTFALIYCDLDPVARVWCALTANIFFNEGKLYFILLGIMLYYTKDNKKQLAIGYTSFVTINSFIILTAIMPRISQYMLRHGYDVLYEIFERISGMLGYNTIIWGGLSPLYNHYEWMSIAALPFILLYNGKKGRSCKMFFYIYYPLHIIILASICYFYYAVR